MVLLSGLKAGALIWHGRDLRRYKRLLSPPLQRLLTCPGTAALGRGVASMPASYAHQVSLAIQYAAVSHAFIPSAQPHNCSSSIHPCIHPFICAYIHSLIHTRFHSYNQLLIGDISGLRFRHTQSCAHLLHVLPSMPMQSRMHHFSNCCKCGAGPAERLCCLAYAPSTVRAASEHAQK